MLSMRPRSSEHDPYYARYIDRVADGALMDRLKDQVGEYRDLLTGVADDRAALPTGPGKWSIKDILGHVADTERVFAFRLTWFARGDTAALPGFEQDDWVVAASSDRQTLVNLLADVAAVREATLTLLGALPEETYERTGVANGQPASVRALAWIIAGHAQHHLDGLRPVVEAS